METALWHKVTEKEKQEIKNQAKTILDNFSKKLEKIKVKEEPFKSNSGLRDEGNGWETQEEFHNTIFSNMFPRDRDRLSP